MLKTCLVTKDSAAIRKIVAVSMDIKRNSTPKSSNDILRMTVALKLVSVRMLKTIVIAANSARYAREFNKAQKISLNANLMFVLDNDIVTI